MNFPIFNADQGTTKKQPNKVIINNKFLNLFSQAKFKYSA